MAHKGRKVQHIGFLKVKLSLTKRNVPKVSGNIEQEDSCMLFSISQGFSVPYQFLFREWIELPAVLRTEVTGWDMQWLFSASVTFYVLDYPYCGYWQIFILCNSWVIIPLKTYKPAFLLIKYPCSIRAWVPISVFLFFSLSFTFLSSTLDHQVLVH